MKGTSPNPALTPNTDRLIVGDQEPSLRSAPKAERKSFGSYLPLDLQREFKAACALQGIEIQDGLEQAIRSWLRDTARQLADEPASWDSPAPRTDD